MSKIIKKITLVIIFLTTILLLTNSMISSPSKAAKPFNLAFVLDIKWDPEETQKPIVPIDEIKLLNLTIIFKIVSDEYMGKGALLYYLYGQNNPALLDISIVETSPGCYAVFKQTFYEMPMVEYNETKVKRLKGSDSVSAPPAALRFGDGPLAEFVQNFSLPRNRKNVQHRRVAGSSRFELGFYRRRCLFMHNCAVVEKGC